MAAIELRSVDKVYPGGRHAVRSFDLTVQDGELLVLLGPSGCGKTTVLRLIAGLESLSRGEILLGGRRVEAEPPQRRNVAMVFQSYALYGHMTVLQNLEFPLRMRGIAPDERRRRALEVAEMLEMGNLLDARPTALSGGQQQRVAMGRALVREPQAFLLDEPLSNLDARLRLQLRGHIRRLQARLGITTVHVTHDQVEALSLGHRVAVLHEGRLQQVGAGQRLYDHPANTFVAAFLGQPGMNLLEGRLVAAASGMAVRVGVSILPVPPDVAAHVRRLNERAGEKIVLGLRPEALRPSPSEATGTIAGEVHAVESLGNERLLYVTVEEGATLAVRLRPDDEGPRPGETATLAIEPGAVRLFDASGRAMDERARTD